MSGKFSCTRGMGGFTLLETIITIVVAGILGTFFLVFMGTNISRSGIPVTLVKDQNRLNQVMENIVADYRDKIKNGTLNLGNFPAAAALFCGSDVGIAASYATYTDPNSDGTYEESTCSYGSAGCNNLKITLSKEDQSVTALFTD